MTPRRATRARRPSPSAVAAGRNEILRTGGSAAWTRRARGAVRDAALRLRPRRRRGARSRRSGRALPPSFDLAFAVKANPQPRGPAAPRRGSGSGADVASGGELRQVLRGGLRRRTAIVFTGPGKRDEELRAAVEAGVRVGHRRVASASCGGWRAIAEAARPAPAGPAPAVGRRGDAARAGPARRRRRRGQVRHGRAPTCASAAAEAVASPWLEPLGVHAFGASNLLDAGGARRRTSRRRSSSRGRLAREAGFELRLVDAGGGLGIPYERTTRRRSTWRRSARGSRRSRDRLARDAATRRHARRCSSPGGSSSGRRARTWHGVVDRKRRGRPARGDPRRRDPPPAPAGARRAGAPGPGR